MVSMKKEDILDFLRQHKVEFAKKFGIKTIALFGSYVRDEAKKESDIDIVVEIESNNTFRSFFEFKYYLESIFGKTVDLGIESNLKPIVKEQIKNEIIYV